MFGSVLLLLWGMLAATASGAEQTFAGGNAGSGLGFVALVFWVAAIVSMYMAFSRSRHGQRACALSAIVSLLVGFALGAGWLFWWLFAGGLVGLAALLSARGEQRQRNGLGQGPTDV